MKGTPQANQCSNLIGVELFVATLLAVSVGGCCASHWHDVGELSETEPVSLQLVLIATHDDRLEFSWTCINRSGASIWVPFEASVGDEGTEKGVPFVYVLPEERLMFAFATPRVSDEQSSSVGMVEAQSIPEVAYVELPQGGRFDGRFAVELPFSPPAEGVPRSVFQYKGEYEHLPGLFSRAVEERETVSRSAERVVLAVEFWLVDPDTGLPRDQHTYRKLHERSLASQALLARKYPGDDLALDACFTRRFVMSSEVKCTVPFVAPVDIYYSAVASGAKDLRNLKRKPEAETVPDTDSLDAGGE